MEKFWIFFPEMTLAQFPKPEFFNFRWIFFPKMTLAQFPDFGFFFQNSRIGVKSGYFGQKSMNSQKLRLKNNVSSQNIH